jgi:hypothetical protein
MSILEGQEFVGGFPPVTPALPTLQFCFILPLTKNCQVNQVFPQLRVIQNKVQ